MKTLQENSQNLPSVLDQLAEGRPARGTFLESPDNFSGPESYIMSAWFTLKLDGFQS